MQRVAIIGTYSFDSLEYHLCDTLRRLTRDARVFDDDHYRPLQVLSSRIYHILRQASPTIERITFERVRKRICDLDPAVVIACHRHIPPTMIEGLKQSLPSSVVLHLNPDTMLTMSYERQRILASRYDAWFTKDRFQHKFMVAKLGLNAFYLPEAYNPHVHIASGPARLDAPDVLVVGGLYPYRSRLLERLESDLSIRVTVRGPCPPWLKTSLTDVSGPLYGPEKATAFFHAKVALNPMHYSEVESANCRLFEIAGAGGFQLCDRNAAVADLLTEDREIVLFSDYRELAEKLKFYLGHPSERHAIGTAASLRARSEHTYEARLKTVWGAIGMRL